MSDRITTDRALWVICAGAAYGPFGCVSDAYATARALRPHAIDRARDTHMTHAASAAEALAGAPWHPRVD